MKENKKIFQILTTDFSFKKIFGTEENKRFLIRFLNCFVSKYTGEIEDLSYLPTEMYGLNENEKKVVFDLLCKDREGRQFIIEMQRARQPEFADRSVFYLSRTISSSSMEKGNRYYRILPTYSVNLLDFELPEYRRTGESFRVIFLKDQKNRVLTKKVGIFYLNLCNFAASQPEVTEEMRVWLNLLKNISSMDDVDYDSQSAFFKELMDECRISKLDIMEKENYEKSVLEYEDVQDALAYAKELAAKEGYDEGLQEGMREGMEQGIKEGMERGIKEGVEQGIKQGIEKGIKQGIEKGIEKGKEEALAQTARNLLEMGLSVEDVIKATGLPASQIKDLQETM
ncbi:MAG: Rpn family recombination-promoting nuclease/putative transposase [Bacteroidales bacterium]|nr:Rpn family recombination-promoting nuclease/putative transposase [Bacteroidales bacterium]